jgi:N-acetylmuramoyl-L-alanine amidase
LKTRWARAALGLVLAGACAAAVAGATRPVAPDVVSVRLGGDAQETRIVVDLRRAVTGALDDQGADANHIALVLKGASAQGALKGAGRGLVRGWRLEERGGGARLALDLSSHATIERRFLLPPADGVVDYRYVIDLAAVGAAPAKGASGAVVRTSYHSAAITETPAPQGHFKKVVVLDPGHGGKDPGAAGASSSEKNVTLATALALKARLERTGRYQVVMTRDSDVFISLEQRVQIARHAGADLFLSLHADSGPDSAIHGASVYTLSERGQQRVGTVLNRHEWFLQQAADSDDRAVGQILLDLTQRTTRNRSASFAQTLIEHVGDRAPLLQRSQRDAGYFVLLAPDVPAALLEMGFITNPVDEARLNDPADRAALTDKIGQAIDDYFQRSTRLAAR